MIKDLTRSLCSVYRQFDTPADQLAIDHQLSEDFAVEFRRRTGQADLATDRIIRELFKARKAHRLPRLRR